MWYLQKHKCEKCYCFLDFYLEFEHLQLSDYHVSSLIVVVFTCKVFSLYARFSRAIFTKSFGILLQKLRLRKSKGSQRRRWSRRRKCSSFSQASAAISRIQPHQPGCPKQGPKSQGPVAGHIVWVRGLFLKIFREQSQVLKIFLNLFSIRLQAPSICVQGKRY